MLEKPCPFCGAPLPEEAAFCPRCAKSLNRRSKKKPPRPFPARLLQRFLLCCLAAALTLGIWFHISPKTYDGLGEITYTDSDGAYQLLSNVSTDRYYPMAKIPQIAGDQESYRFPLRLYMNHRDTGLDVSGMFLQKVASCEVFIEQPADSPRPVTASRPMPADEFPGVAMVSYIDYSRQSANPIELVWNLRMANKDTIRIRSTLTVTPTQTYYYNSENADLSDSEALQDFIDQLARETRPEDVVNIHLPPVTYTEPLILSGRAFNLIGSRSGKQRTAFAAGIQMRAQEGAQNWISHFADMDFSGNGSGVGISAANRVWAENCRFTGWKTAVLAYGDTWVNTVGCTFEDNQTGLHYNAGGGFGSDTRFTENTFRNNGTAVLLEKVSADLRMDFSGCLFEGNETDIDNRCNQPVSISQAVFQ